MADGIRRFSGSQWWPKVAREVPRRLPDRDLPLGALLPRTRGRRNAVAQLALEGDTINFKEFLESYRTYYVGITEKNRTYLLRFVERGRDSQPERRQLARDLAEQLRANLPRVELRCTHGRIFLDTPVDASSSLGKLHGLLSYSQCVPCSLEELEDTLCEFARERLSRVSSFAVAVRRCGQHGFRSQALAARLGALVCAELPHLRVDLAAPERTVGIEIRDHRCWIYDSVVPGVDSQDRGHAPISREAPCLLVDQMLGRLATWLRLLGFDTGYMKDVPDSVLVRRALAEGRLLLTRDRALAKTPGVAVHLVEHDEVATQLRELVTCFDLRVRRERLFSRCTLCNSPLTSVDKEDVRARIPPVAYRLYESFKTCFYCQKVYWPGGHYDRILLAVGNLIG